VLVIWTISYHDNLPTAAQEKMCAPSNSFSSERIRTAIPNIRNS
jgi:hypothetical protein